MYFLNLAAERMTFVRFGLFVHGRHDTWSSARTFLKTRESEELDEAEVVARHQHCAAVIGVHRVDVIDVGVFRPDSIHLGSENTCPRHPVDSFGFLLRQEFTG